jgi:hypothetical protein
MEVGSSSQPPPRKDKKMVPRSPCKQTAAKIVLLCIPEGVHVLANLLGYVEKLRYSYHYVMNTDKFLEFAKQVYLQIVGIGPFGELIHQPLQWAAGLDKTRILSLLDLPHFGRGQYATSCVKQLMAVTHGGYLWLEQLVSIDVEFITHITGLPS